MAIFTLIMAAAAASAPSAAPSPVCAKLANDYDHVERAIASSQMGGVGDNSAVRETNRKLDEIYQLQMAQITIDLMRDNHCAMPKRPPEPQAYYLPAINCTRDSVGATTLPPSCKMSEWQREQPEAGK